jgi:hypothetical protein
MTPVRYILYRYACLVLGSAYKKPNTGNHHFCRFWLIYADGVKSDAGLIKDNTSYLHKLLWREIPPSSYYWLSGSHNPDLRSRARLVKSHNQINTGLVCFVDKPAVIWRPQLQAITRFHFVAGIALQKH